MNNKAHWTVVMMILFSCIYYNVLMKIIYYDVHKSLTFYWGYELGAHCCDVAPLLFVIGTKR